MQWLFFFQSGVIIRGGVEVTTMQWVTAMNVVVVKTASTLTAIMESVTIGE